MSRNKPFYILSVDGGGLKGLIAIRVLHVIEEMTQQSLQDKFDFFAGTSTGGLIVSALNTKKKDKSYYELRDIEELYLEVAESVFDKGRYTLTGEEHLQLNRIFRSIFGSKKIAESASPLFIPAYDATNAQNIFFSTREGLLKEEKNLPLLDVCHATSAVPSVFPPHPILYDGILIECVDAGLYQLKNPTLSALEEVWTNRKWYRSHLSEEDIVVLSISTGSFYNKRNNWTTDIAKVYSPDLLKSSLPGMDHRKIRFMRIDISMRSEGYSIGHIIEWINAISALSTDKAFRADVDRVLY